MAAIIALTNDQDGLESVNIQDLDRPVYSLLAEFHSRPRERVLTLRATDYPLIIALDA